MDPKRAHLVTAIQQAMVAARACGDAMSEYLLSVALSQALEEERREIARIAPSLVPKGPTIN